MDGARAKGKASKVVREGDTAVPVWVWRWWWGCDDQEGGRGGRSQDRRTIIGFM